SLSKACQPTSALRGDLVDGWRTPTYALAWVCPPRTFYENLGGGTEWAAWPDFGYDLGLLPCAHALPGADGNFYLIAMFNKPDTDHLARVRNLKEDPLIESARWYRWPLDWLHAEEREREG
ncbi:hypothetical protein B0H13DRAFT_2026653, partial [Mycena leptocephala]